MAQWRKTFSGLYGLPLGKIGWVIIEPENGNYIITYQDSDRPVYGEGTRIYDKENNQRRAFPLTSSGLNLAKIRAVEFAKELLTEALDSLEKDKVV